MLVRSLRPCLGPPPQGLQVPWTSSQPLVTLVRHGAGGLTGQVGAGVMGWCVSVPLQAQGMATWGGAWHRQLTAKDGYPHPGASAH